MNNYFKWRLKYQMSKLELADLIDEKRTFKFDLP